MSVAMEDTPPADPAHIPVMRDAVTELLEPQPGEVCLDVTLGAGGHAEALCVRLERGVYVGLDRDPVALKQAERRLRGCPHGVRLELVRGTFADARAALAKARVVAADMVFADLGVSSMQMDDRGRGFSYQHDAAELDLRMGPDAGPPATVRIEEADPEELAQVLRDYGEVRRARSLARSLAQTPPTTVGELKIRIGEVERREQRGRLWARVFQALRIWVNDELGQLERLLADVPELVRPGARLAIISYHSLEDRRVKRVFRDWEKGCVCPPEVPVCVCGGRSRGCRITRRPIRPEPSEVEANPRSRSALLRGFRFEEGVPA